MTRTDTDELTSLAKLTIAEMSKEVVEFFLSTTPEVREEIAILYMSNAVEKQNKITQMLKSYPHKMEEMRGIVYDNLVRG